MADYYPLIARAVAGLDRNTGEARRTVYERARAALVAQLRGVTPALNESDVTRERLALEEAIRKVEAESARQTASRIDAAVKVKAPEFPRWQEPEPEPPPPPPARLPRGKPPRGDGRAATAPAASARARAEPRHVEPDDEVSLPPDDRIELEPPRQRPDDAIEPEPAPRRREAAPRPDGRMPAAAGRAKPEARRAESRNEPPEPTEPPRPAWRARLERAANGRERASNERERTSNERERAANDRRVSPNSGLRELLSEADELGGATARAKKSARDSFAAVPAPPPEPRRAQAPRTAESDDAFMEFDEVDEPVMLEPSFIVDESRPAPPRARKASPPPRPVDPDAPPRRSIADMIRIGSAAALLALVVAVLVWQLPTMVALYRSLWTPSSDVVKEEPAPQPSVKPPKLPDRLEPGSAPPQQPAELASVAQRVVLYEEDPANPQGRRSVGSAVWRTEAVSPGPGKSPELAVRADIEIPERKISMTWTLRRDTDQNRATSHTIEIMIKLPSDFQSGGVLNIPGIWMKQAEETQGTALAGLAIKVTTGYFLIGLSATPAERDRNIQLLKDRPWFEMPIVYTNNRRAILAVEKGTPGDNAFKQAFAVWEK